MAGPAEGYLIPGFVDAHVHVESNMLLPSKFARLAVTLGTVATVSDPHEIAPCCVPATTFEIAGDAIDSDAVGHLLERPDFSYLSEKMNFPRVMHGDPEVLKKIAHAKRISKPVHGHGPGLRGDEVMLHAAAGSAPTLIVLGMKKRWTSWRRHVGADTRSQCGQELRGAVA